MPPGVPDADHASPRTGSPYQCAVRRDPRSGHKSHCSHETKPVGEGETEAEIREFIAEYYGMIHNIDWNLADSKSANALGIAEDTMVIFLSDHGDMLGQHGSFCGIKTKASVPPCTCRNRSIRFEPHRTDAMIDVGVDMMATLFDLVGIDMPEGRDSQSYLPVLMARQRTTEAGFGIRSSANRRQPD